MSYSVYLVENIGAPRNHKRIFVETAEGNGNNSGHIFHVIGSMQNGMTYEEKTDEAPEEDGGYSSKKLLGSVTKERYSRVFEICQGIPPPRKQFQYHKRLYPNEPLRSCQEWAREAIAALRAADVLV